MKSYIIVRIDFGIYSTSLRSSARALALEIREDDFERLDWERNRRPFDRGCEKNRQLSADIHSIGSNHSASS
jgi:hypothetical protein